MTHPHQTIDDRTAHQAGGASDQHPQRSGGGLRALVGRAWFSGSVASLASALALAAAARGRRDAAAGPVNDISHWVWGRRGLGRDRASLRHTALGYAIHHASSVFWATAFEWLAPPRASRKRAAGAAAATAVVAYVVDFHGVPHRLSPGFQHRLPFAGRAAAYAAFAAGLYATHRIRRHISAPRPRDDAIA